MIRSIFNKWTIGAISLLLIIAAGCYIYYQIDTAAYRQEATETATLLQQWETNEKAVTKPTSPKVPAENATAEKSIDTSQASETSEEIAVNSDMPVSPYGYGPYPDVPDDYREAKGKPIWEHSKWPDGIALPRGAELLHRVMIKVWKEGNQDWIGAGGGNSGKVWINYPNTLYIWYGEPYEDADGTIVRPIRRAKGDPNAQLTPDEMRRGIIPSGVRVLDGETEAIDVFEYLNLSTK